MRLELIKADTVYEGMSISEDACKSVVDSFKGPVSITFATTKLIMGKIVSVEYDPITKAIYGEVELDIVVMAGVDGTKSIDTPIGKRIIDGILTSGILVPKSLMPGGKNAHKMDK